MEILLGLGELERSRPRAAAIGVFDGFHRGHRALLGRLVREARRQGWTSTVVTFDPHPEVVLRGSAPPRISDPEQVLEGLAEVGVDEVVVQPFDRRFSELDPEAFLRLVGAGAGLRAFVMTPGATFGHQRRGTAAAVAALGQRLGFRLVLVEPLASGSEPVSSSRIRAAIEAGRLAEARRLLGHGVGVTGHASPGQPGGTGAGGLMVDPSEPFVMPPAGTYVARLQWRGGGRARGAAGPLGSRRLGGPWRSGSGVAVVRPGAALVEVRMDDASAPPAGATVRLEFVRRRRTGHRSATRAAEAP